MNTISRKAALSQHLTKYFTGKPCFNGHVAERYVGNWSCVQCRPLLPRTQYHRELYQTRRIKAVNLLGGVCNHCGLSDTRILHIDHINGDGAKDRTVSSTGSLADILNRGLIEKYQLLCSNCNWIKRFTNNELGVIVNTASYWGRLRTRVLKAFGDHCAKCGNTDARCLQLDHINGGGCKELKRIGSEAIYRKALKEPSNYQVLCTNCNWLKRYE